jgi:hypothetical protein
MTPEILDAHRASHPMASALPPCSEALALRQGLEEACAEDPFDEELARLLFHSHTLVQLLEMASDPMGPMRPEKLVRWDQWTSTWSGTDRRTGQDYLIRIIHRDKRLDPFFTRALRRDKHVLETFYPKLQLTGEHDEMLVLPLEGAPYGHSQGALPFNQGVALIGQGLDFLERWREQGLTAPQLSLLELRDDGGNLRITCLSPFSKHNNATPVHHLLGLLQPACEGTESIQAFFKLIHTFQGDDLDRIGGAWRALLSATLTTERHRLALQWRRVFVANRASRLYAAVERLHRAFPAPAGRGVLGVDMNGMPLVLESTPELIRWGSEGENKLILGPDRVLQPREARRALRARASATLNQRLHMENQADPLFTEAICAWLSSSMRLRAVRLMLEATFKAA